VGLFLIATTSNNSASFAQHYSTLFLFNGTLAVGLATLVISQLMALKRRLKAGIFGTKLTLRLVILFTVMSILPGVLIYGMSIQFLGKSIESWFDVKVDKALEGGLKLSQVMLDNMLRELKDKGTAMAFQLSTRPTSEHALILNGLREQAGVTEATLFTNRGRMITRAGSADVGVLPEIPTPETFRLLRTQPIYAVAEAPPDRGLQLKVLVLVNVMSVNEDSRVLQLVKQVSPTLAQHAETMQSGYREYQELLLSRTGLKRLYGITLSITLLLSVLAALAAAFFISEQLSAPLIALVEGTRAVAQGDYSRRANISSKDELGLLMQSFNGMTVQLEDARDLAERKQTEVVQSKAYLESILAHLSAGVLVFDENWVLRSANSSASAILGRQSEDLIGLSVFSWHEIDQSLLPLGEAINNSFDSIEQTQWERQVKRQTQWGEQQLLLRGKRLPQGFDQGYVVVFDDVTQVLQAQRNAAWAEVARRLAHEIKNPLTPIQLSAERLQMKLGPKLDTNDAGILGRSTQTIVNQVTALKQMVDAFSQYARAPEAEMRELDFNALVNEVLILYESMGSKIQLNLSMPSPKIIGDAALLRQVIHNLLQNAQDALEHVENPQIVIISLIQEGRLDFYVNDNGSGFPENLSQRLFEPYVTTKKKGTGLGLVIVRKIVDEHGGKISIRNVEPHGASVRVQLPLLKNNT
jgi:PAS domain S-box-containing protein